MRLGKLHSSRVVVPLGLLFENDSEILFRYLLSLYLYGHFYISSFPKILNDYDYLHAKGRVSR